MNQIKLLPTKYGKIRSGGWNLEQTDQIIHSDTLVSAICNNYSLLYGNDELKKLLEQWKSEKSPRFSSLFPMIRITVKNEEKKTETQYDLCFYPKPNLSIIPHNEDYFRENFKKWKKIEFVSRSVLLNILSAQKITVKEPYILASTFLLDAGDVEELKDLNMNLEELMTFIPYLNLDEDHVSLDRITNTSIPFLVSFLQFNEKTLIINRTKRVLVKTGLHCLCEGNLTERIAASIRLIADEGLGGKRSTGSGLFASIEFSEIDSLITEQAQNDAHLILSLVHPSIDEFGKMIYYSLLKRGGYMYTPWNRASFVKNVHMISEGSIAKQAIKGNFINITPNGFTKHPIYKFGLAFTLPIPKLVK